MAHRDTPRRERGQLAGVPALIATIPRRLRTEIPLVATMVGVVLIVAIIATSLPRLYNRMADDALVYDVENANIFIRNLNAILLSHTLPGEDDVFGPVEQAGIDFLDAQTPAIQDIVVDSNWVLDSPNYVVTDVPGAPVYAFDRFMRFRYQSEVYDNIELIDGRLPERRDPIPPPCIGDCPETNERWQLFEVAISRETSEQIGMQPGDQVILTPDRADIQHRSRDFATLQMSIVLEVSGIFEPLNVGDPYWYEDRRLQRAEEVDTGNALLYYATGLIAPDAYGQLLDLNPLATWTYSHRYYVDPERFNGGNLPQLAADIRNAEFTYSGSGGYAPPGEFFLRTGLSRVFSRYESNRSQAIATLSLATVGLLAVTVSVMTLMAALIIERRRHSIALLRGRGGSSLQLTLAQVIEGIALTIPPVLLGYVAAQLLVSARTNRWSLVAAAAVVVVSTAVMALVARSWFRRPLQEIEDGPARPRRTSARQIVLEVTVVALAVSGVILLRRRGISPEGATGEGSGFDPYLAAVPILLGLATGLAALRIYPIPVRFFAWLASLRRDIVPFVGLRRVSGQAGASRLPLLVILLAVALAVFSTTMQRSIDHGQTETSWHVAGANFRIEPPLSGGNLSRLIDVSGVEGVEAIATATISNMGQVLSDSGRNQGTIRLMMVETADYQQVAGGTPADPRFPETMLREQNINEIGTQVNPIPAIISERWSAGARPDPGQTFTISMRGTDFVFVVQEIRDRFAGLPENEPFVVTSLQSVADANTRLQWLPSIQLVKADPGARQRIEETVRSQSQFSRVVSREALYDRVRNAPLTSGVRTGFQLSVVLATICASLAAIVSLALTARARSRDLAYLRTLGLSTNQALWLTMLEQLPPVMVAGIVGCLLGAGTAVLIEPGLDLTAFTGEGLRAGLSLDWGPIAMVALVVVVVVILAVAAFGFVSRSINLGQVLRAGDR